MRKIRRWCLAALAAASLGSMAWAAGDSIDIGSPGVKGSSNNAGNLWTVTGAGTNIFGTSDQFHFSHQNIVGDGMVIAKIEAIQSQDPWAKAGVMIRSGTGAGDTHAALIATPGNGILFQWRNATGGQTKTVPEASVSLPVWLRLVRKGNDFAASYSSDGRKWTDIGQNQTVPMNKAALAGMAVASRSDKEACTATFSGFSIKR